MASPLPPAKPSPAPTSSAKRLRTLVAAKPHHILTRRLQQLGAIGALLLLVLMGRLVYLQLFTGNELHQKASQSLSHAISLYHWGTILDRHGMVMAQDQILYDAFAHPEYFGKASP